MNVPTALQEAGTPKTPDIVTVTPAVSTQPQRIDRFISEKLSEARSAESLSDSRVATRLLQLGFANSANSRYAQFLEAFRSAPRLADAYKADYPDSLFLPWRALHLVRKTLGLQFDLPEHYIGAVPESQVGYMEKFELKYDDHILLEDFCQFLPEDFGGGGGSRQRWVMAIDDALWDGHMGLPSNVGSDREWRTAAGNAFRIAKLSLFVGAPPEAFNTQKGFTERFEMELREIGLPELVTRQAPDDPIVFRLCRGGALVVASWGDEAAELNRLTRELKI